MTDRPHNALFVAAFEQPEHAAGLFRSLLPGPVVQSIAWDTLALESGTFIDPDLAERQSDLLYSAEIVGGRTLLYLLLEHKSTSDPETPLQMLIYMVRVLERYRKEHPRDPLPIIVPILVCHAPGGWRGPRTFHEMFEPDPRDIAGLAELVPSFSLLIEDLAHLSNEEIKARALAVFPSLALWVLRDARDASRLLDNLSAWGAALSAAAQTPHGMAALGQLMRYIAIVTDDLHLKAFRAKIKEQAPEAEQVTMTIAEEMRREGEARGRVQTLVRVLTLRFGGVTAEQETTLAHASPEQLERYVERAVRAAQLEDVFLDEDEA